MMSSCLLNGELVKNASQCALTRYCFYYDNVHPSTTVHALFGAIASESILNSYIEYTQEFINDVIEKYNLKKLYIKTENGYILDPKVSNGALGTSHGMEYIFDNKDNIIQNKNAESNE
ncbi:hypothetical protein AYI70_g3965 [Smittium culicis]|uniref:Thermolabile hemolysin n=1 Tax=Smittium culicis TaxID=133412 RepID=A0A1R1Y1H1_9FUNG|nr:hypothetical protein AYI70_g3965 [Smittium culicis]